MFDYLQKNDMFYDGVVDFYRAVGASNLDSEAKEDRLLIYLNDIDLYF